MGNDPQIGPTLELFCQQEHYSVIPKDPNYPELTLLYHQHTRTQFALLSVPNSKQLIDADQVMPPLKFSRKQAYAMYEWTSLNLQDYARYLAATNPKPVERQEFIHILESVVIGYANASLHSSHNTCLSVSFRNVRIFTGFQARSKLSLKVVPPILARGGLNSHSVYDERVCCKHAQGKHSEAQVLGHLMVKLTRCLQGRPMERFQLTVQQLQSLYGKEAFELISLLLDDQPWRTILEKAKSLRISEGSGYFIREDYFLKKNRTAESISKIEGDDGPLLHEEFCSDGSSKMEQSTQSGLYSGLYSGPYSESGCSPLHLRRPVSTMNAPTTSQFALHKIEEEPHVRTKREQFFRSAKEVTSETKVELSEISFLLDRQKQKTPERGMGDLKIRESQSSLLSSDSSRERTVEAYVGGCNSRGEMEGQGKAQFQNGYVYYGEFRRGKMEGYGKLFYSSGRLAFEGYFHKGCFHRYGKIYSANPVYAKQIDFRNFADSEDTSQTQWKFYEGEIDHDLRHGQGLLMFENGEKFQGQFKWGVADGLGTFLGKSKTVRGLWAKGQFLHSLS